MVDGINRQEMAQARHPGFKTCSTCGRTKLLENFYATHGQCKTCVLSKAKARYAKKKDEKPARARRAYTAEQRAAWANRDYKRRMGITFEQRDAMLAAQGGVCAACGAAEPGGRGWATDHDHACCPSRAKSCGECVRGILCHDCNVGLGNFKDDIERLRSAIDYLTTWEARNG